MSTRQARAQIARETFAILERGVYRGPDGRHVSIADAARSARDRSVLYPPDRFEDVLATRDRLLQTRGTEPQIVFEVVNETTLSASRRLLEQQPGARVLALNFASARNPGGGFLNGSQAQEESLARASALYPCLLQFLEPMYEVNRRFSSCLYTDHMIYSPDVPVFRDDEDRLLHSPYTVSILTVPAVNAGAVRANEPENVPRIEEVMRARVEKVLTLAVVHGHDTLVLGAWGCGVFANDPDAVAGWFGDALLGGGPFRAAFRRVVFAVLDRTKDGATIRPFLRRFASGG